MLTKILLMLLLVPTLALAEETRPLSVEVLWEMDRVGSPVIAPVGSHVVVPVTAYDMETDESETRLWLLSTDGEVQRPLTAEGASAGNPVFSPDGKMLAFTSKRDDDEATQIYVLPMGGPGEATRLSDVPTGASALRWVGEHLYFISRVWPDKTWEEIAEHIKAEKESKVSARQWNALPYSYWDHWIEEDRQAHVFRIPVDGGEVEAVTKAMGRELPRAAQGVDDYDISPDGTLIAFTSDSRNGDNVDPDIDLFLGKVGSDAAENLTAANVAGDGSPMFSPDGRTLAYTRQAISGFYADNINVVLHDLASGEAREITSDWDRSATGLVWTPDNKGFYGSIDDAGTRRIHYIDAGTGATRAVTKETSFGGLSIADDGTLVANNQSFLYPPRIVRVEPSGTAVRLATFNDEVLANVDLGTYESVTYTGHNGAEIQMWVHYPPGFDRSQRYPLFLLIHGGPHNAIPNGWHFRWNAQTFASWGYVTAWHNFHGSSGFGQDFADAINPDWVTAPYNDTIAAADWFAEKDWIDPERMVAGGGSYGGYLSSILLGKEHPFNALMIHAPVYNMYSQMAADFSVHSTRFGSFWEAPEIYREISPHYYAGDFDTPALIIHGQLDYRVPVGQSFELFRTLQTKGVDSRLIYFPDENHWILKPNNSVYWYHEVRRWMEQYAAPAK